MGIKLEKVRRASKTESKKELGCSASNWTVRACKRTRKGTRAHLYGVVGFVPKAQLTWLPCHCYKPADRD